MPKEILELTELTKMAPSYGGGNLPILASGMVINTPDGSVIPENTDNVIDTDIINDVAVTINGAIYHISTDGTTIFVTLNNSILKSFHGTFTTATQIGGIVTLNNDEENFPIVVAFRTMDSSYVPIFENTDAVIEIDNISAHGNPGSIKRIIMLNDNMSLLLFESSDTIAVIFNAETTIGETTYDPGDILYTQSLCSGRIIDITADYSQGVAVKYTDIYYVYTSILEDDYYISKIDLGSAFTGGDTSDYTAFLPTTFEALTQPVGFVQLNFATLETESKINTIAVTNTKIFFGAAIPSRGISWSNNEYSYTIHDDKDIMYAIDKEIVDPSLSKLAITFSVANDVTSELLHASKLPFMPYHTESPDACTAPGSPLARIFVGNKGVCVPYGYPINDIMDDWAMRANNRLYCHSNVSTITSGTTRVFAFKMPGNCGIAPREITSSPTVYIPGELSVLDYLTDKCGMYVISTENMNVPAYLGTTNYLNRLVWELETYPGLPSVAGNALLTGTGNDAGIMQIWLRYGNYNIINQVRTVGTNNWSLLDPSSIVDEDTKLFLYVWDGNQPRETNDEKYEGIPLSYDVFETEVGEDFGDDGPPVSPYGYQNEGKLWWYSQYSSIPEIDYSLLKFFDTTECSTTIGTRECLLLPVQNNTDLILNTHSSSIPPIIDENSLGIICVEEPGGISHYVGASYNGTQQDANASIYKLSSYVICDEDASTEISDINIVTASKLPTSDMICVYSGLNVYQITDSSSPVAGLCIHDDAAISLLNTTSIISVESALDSASSMQNYSTRYRYSFIYDGLHDGPISTFYDDAERIVESEGPPIVWGTYNATITVNIPLQLAQTTSKRITGIRIYAAQIDGDEEIELYRLVETINLSKTLFTNSGTDVYTRIITDTGNRGASFEATAGYPETYENVSARRGCQCECAGYLFAGNVRVEDSNSTGYTGNTILRSLPGQPSVFDYSRDFLVIPFTPLAMAEFDSRLYVFGEKKYAIIDPNNMSIDHISNNIGCISPHHVVSCDKGLFVYFNKRVYAVDGQNTVDISIPIYSTSIGDITNIDNVIVPTLDHIGDWEGQFLGYLANRDSLILAFSDIKYDKLHIYLFSIDMQKWVYYSIDAESAPISMFESNGTIIIRASSFSGSGVYNYELFTGEDKRRINIQWILDLADSGHKTQIYDIRAYNGASTRQVEISLDGVSPVFGTSGISKSRTKLSIAEATSELSTGFNNIKLIVRRFVVK